MMLEPVEKSKDLCCYTGVVLREAHTKEDELQSSGSLNIVEYSFGKCIEWKPQEISIVSENADQDPGWSVVEAHTKNTQKFSGSPNFLVRTKIIRILISDLKSFQVKYGGQQLKLKLIDGTIYVAFFHTSNAESFVKSLKSFIRFVKSKTDKNLYFVRDTLTPAENNSFVELNLFQENTSDYVWKFVKNLHNRPYETTLEAFSKLTDIWLYKEPAKQPVEETVADFFSGSLKPEIFQPFTSCTTEDEYDIIEQTRQKILFPQQPLCLRGEPLNQEQWDSFKDTAERITNPDGVRQVVFRGGIIPSLRCEVWKFLLNYHPWNSTSIERIELERVKTDDYYKMKLQWRSMSTEQENNFSDFRDRKSLIEKDVNRTDRNHPYYSGDNNSHLVQLYEILMTYVMYNFDLGYVQGMSDLLSPILCLMDNEVDAFWCFVGFMEKVSSNFEVNQIGMKNQLCHLRTLLQFIEPELAQYLDKNDSGNMFFCFRWLLVLFKRELSPVDTMKLWEVLWTDLPCKNFHLLLCIAILHSEKNALMENRYGFTEILKHINDLSLHIDLSQALSKAEAIYEQFKAVASSLPDDVLSIIGLESSESSKQSTSGSNNHNSSISEQNTRCISDKQGEGEKLEIDRNSNAASL